MWRGCFSSLSLVPKLHLGTHFPAKLHFAILPSLHTPILKLRLAALAGGGGATAGIIAFPSATWERGGGVVSFPPSCLRAFVPSCENDTLSKETEFPRQLRDPLQGSAKCASRELSRDAAGQSQSGDWERGVCASLTRISLRPLRLFARDLLPTRPPPRSGRTVRDAGRPRRPLVCAASSGCTWRRACE